MLFRWRRRSDGEAVACPRRQTQDCFLKIPQDSSPICVSGYLDAEWNAPDPCAATRSLTLKLMLLRGESLLTRNFVEPNMAGDTGLFSP